MRTAWVTLAALALIGADTPPDFKADAAALDRMIVENYAYSERLPGGVLPDSPALAAARAAVHDRSSLLHYAEDRLATLADHHASTGSSFRDSWALVPSYADLWITDDYRVDAVRNASPAAVAGIASGDRLVAVDGVPIAQSVTRYWAAFGLDAVGERAGYAARVLAAGRRDRPRRLTIAHGGVERALTLPHLYAAQSDARQPVTAIRGRDGGMTIRFGNSLGDSGTIAAFDAAMALVPDRAAVTLDLTDTPSGGNTSVARAIMGWFVRRPTSYQVHGLPAEERETGIARQWIEQVLPRAGKHHAGPVTAVVGRWTGSMGEGLAIGLDAIGARVCGGPMAGLRGAIYDFTLPASGLVVKFPAERLYTVGGVPRERVVPKSCPASVQQTVRASW